MQQNVASKKTARDLEQVVQFLKNLEILIFWLLIFGGRGGELF